MESEKIAAIGSGQQMLALKSIGVRTVEVEGDNFAEAGEKLGELAREDGLSLILIGESLAEGIGAHFVADIRESTGKVIMAMPSHEGSAGLTTRWLKESMEHSIGVDLISD